MEFWGVEVKSGEVLKCDPGDDKYLHISQVALGEIKNAKGTERITLYVHVDNKKFVIGSLVYGKSDQFSLDLVFEREFKLSHSCTTGSAFFSGYTTLTDGGDEAMGGFDGTGKNTDSDSEDEQQAQALMSQVKENVGRSVARLVKPEAKKDGAKSAKPAVSSRKEGAKVKTKVNPVSAPKPGEDEESSDEEDDDKDGDEDMDGSSDEEAESDESDADSENESDEEEDEKPPKAASKKKPYPDSAIKSPGTYKKAKTSTPSGAQTLGKKNGPKVPGVTSAPASKEHKGQIPKVKGTAGSKETHKPPTTPGSEKKIGEHPCTPCGKIFKTESALLQHSTAKHGKK